MDYVSQNHVGGPSPPLGLQHQIHPLPSSPAFKDRQTAPVPRRPLHHALPHNRLPGRTTSCPNPPSPPSLCAVPRPRCSRLRLLPVPDRRGKGRQVRRQRLCRPDDDAGVGVQGGNPLPAFSRPDRGAAELCIPGTPYSRQTAMGSSTDAQLAHRPPTEDRPCALSAKPSSWALN
jgi:hypothetical protein